MGPDTKVMRSRPWVEEESVRWLEAFQALTHSRPAGFSGALPIPLTEIDAYCRIMEIPPVDRPGFLQLLRRIDLGYLELLEKRKNVTVKQPDP